MITVNPRNDALDPDLIDAYRKVAPATLGHALQSGMDPDIRALWRPVQLVGPALTVQTTPDVTGAVNQAMEVARPGDVLVVNTAGEMRHGTTGEWGAHGYIDCGIVGLVTDGLISDSVALERMKFPVFCRGLSTALFRPLASGRQAEGSVNVPVLVGGVLVSPGDLILADDDGVMVATPQEAREQLAFSQEMEEWEAYARAQMAAGRTWGDVRKERDSFRDKFYERARS